VFLRKKKKHLNVTSLIIWNFLTQKSIIFVVVTFPNNHFFFLNRNLATPSLSSQQKITKKKRKIKLGIKIYFLKNLISKNDEELK
jgi:hypothetical protein